MINQFMYSQPSFAEISKKTTDYEIAFDQSITCKRPLRHAICVKIGNNVDLVGKDDFW